MKQQSIADFIDLDHLQRLQDCCSRATGVALVTVDYRGVPVTEYSGFTAHCALGRTDPKFRALCEQCDAHGGLRSTMTSEPCIYRCHAGLVDLAVPLIVNGSYVGAVLGGQVRLTDEPTDLGSVIPPRDSLVEDEDLAHRLAQAFDEVPMTSYDKLRATVETLHELVTYAIGTDLGTQGGGAAQLRERTEQLARERAARQELEVEVRRRDGVARRRDEALAHFGFATNAIHLLATKEGAKATDAAVLDYVDVVHYLTETDDVVVPLGDELDYMSALLRIYQGWFGDGLRFEVRVPERYRSALCPFMTMHPIAMSVVGGLSENAQVPRSIEVSAVESDGQLVVRVLEEGLSVLELSNVLDAEDESDRFSLEAADRNLSRMTRGASSIRARSNPATPDGALITFSLPLGRD